MPLLTFEEVWAASMPLTIEELHKVRDASGHDHAADGKFGSGGSKKAKPVKGSAKGSARVMGSKRTSAAASVRAGTRRSAPSTPAIGDKSKAPAARLSPTAAAAGVKAKLSPTSKRAWNGDPVPLKNKPTSQQVGAIGEKVAIAYLKAAGIPDATPLNGKKSNYSVDAFGDHACFEFKTGLASNGKQAQQWRATIGEPGPAEKAMLAKMSPPKKRAWNAQKKQAIMDRKDAAVKEQCKARGIKTLKQRTVTIILNPDTKTADVHVIEGFHHRIGWKDDAAKAGFVGSFKYE